MKKIIFIIMMVLTIMGCSSTEKIDGKILKKQNFDGSIKIRFEGRAERVFLGGDIVNLGHEYYLVPGEYLVSWNPRSYISLGVSIGGAGKRKNSDIDQRSSIKISIEKDSIVELKGSSAKIIEVGGSL